MTLPLVYR